MRLFHLWFVHEPKRKRVFDLKKCLVLVLLFVSLIIVGCVVHDTERPFNYPPAKWISVTPDISFIVSDESYSESVGVNTSDYILDGNLNSNGENIKLEVYFDPGRTVTFFDKSNSSNLGIGDIEKYDFVLLEGVCKFSPDKLVVTIDKKTDKVF